MTGKAARTGLALIIAITAFLSVPEESLAYDPPPSTAGKYRVVLSGIVGREFKSVLRSG